MLYDDTNQESEFVHASERTAFYSIPTNLSPLFALYLEDCNKALHNFITRVQNLFYRFNPLKTKRICFI
jgi:hypothetical protein